MTTAQVTYSQDELLASHDYAEPLLAGGVRCHGGFDETGRYVSPRTLHRVPAIEAWQAQRAEQFGTPLLDVALDRWPEHYPNVAQARFLIESGVREPIISTLTRVGTVEGFGGLIRHSVLPDLQSCFEEDVRGTAMAHLHGGLYEAHARDEAGHEDQAGHKEMWFAARDVAFEDPVTEDETVVMLERMGIARPGSGGKIDVARMRADALANRVLPDDVDFDLESTINRMARLLLIEISAFHTFAWAEELLDDPDLVAGDGEAARIVSYIRADETPHVEYLKTVLSEMRDRTFVGSSGHRHAGTDLVHRIWDRAVEDSLTTRRAEGLRTTLAEVTHAIGDRPDAADLLERFHALGSIRPGPDGTWVAQDTAA
jgi:hypothetical protein